MGDGRRVVVTGGAGFIGSHTVRALLEKGHEVVVVDDLSTGRRSRLELEEGERAGLRLLVGDIRDRALLTEALEGVSHVLHLAARPSVARSVRDPWTTHDVNVSGTVQLLDVARSKGVRRVVVASSSSVYGDVPGGGAKHEELPPRPASPYAASKLACESYALAWSRCYGMEAVALRYFNVFGPGQDPDSEYSAVIPRFIRAAQTGRPLTIHGDGLQTRDFTAVDNVVDANLRALFEPGGNGLALNIGCGEERSLLDLTRELETLRGAELKVEHGPPRTGDVRQSRADIRRAGEAIGYQPRTGFAEGLRVAWQSFAAV